MDPISAVQAGGADALTIDRGISSLTSTEFLDLLITQLANQDPLSPVENDQILNQVASLRDIEASRDLSDTLDQFLQVQQLVGASNLIGRAIEGLTASGKNVVGTVDSVLVQDGTVVLQVGADSIPVENVRRVLVVSE